MRDNLEIAARLQPGNAGVWLGLGRAAMELNDLKRREQASRSHRAQAGVVRGVPAARLRPITRAEAARLAPGVHQGQHARSPDAVSVCMIGYVFERLAGNDAAVKCYAKALKLKPNDEMASKLMAGINLND